MEHLWQYDFSRPLRLSSAIEISSTTSSHSNNFVKSIRMAPSGYSFLYSTEEGMLYYVNLQDIDFWYTDETVSNPLQTLEQGICFPHTEVIYDMTWFN